MTMANNGWDREIINAQEKPLASDINTLQSQIDRALRETMMRVFTARGGMGSSDLAGNPPSGFIGEGFKVKQTSPLGLSILVKAGLGFQYLPGDVPASVGGVGGLDDLSVYKPLSLTADATINGISGGPGAGNTRIDIVEVRMNRAVGNSTNRRVLNVMTGVFDPLNVNKTMGFTLDGSTGVVTAPADSTAAISYKQGIAGVTPAEPPTTAGYVKIATIKVSTSLSQVTTAEIIDQRPLLAPSGMQPFSATFSIPSGGAAPPTALQYMGPPGTSILVVKTAPPAQNRFQLFLIGGGAPIGGTIHCQAVRTYAAGELVLAYPEYVPVVGQLTAPLAALLADATKTANAQSLPVGTNYLECYFSTVRQTGGTTDTSVPDPLLVSVSGHIQRY